MHRFLLEADEQIGNNGGTNRTTYEAYNWEANFDASMVIILAALLIALIFALGLNSIIQRVLRCGWRFNATSAAASADDDTAAATAATGMKKRELRRIPVAAYGSDEAVNIIATECAICLGDFADGDRVRVLPKCNHGFHEPCIDAWLVSHSSCPNCRNSLIAVDPNAPSGRVNPAHSSMYI